MIICQPLVCSDLGLLIYLAAHYHNAWVLDIARFGEVGNARAEEFQTGTGSSRAFLYPFVNPDSENLRGIN